MKKIIIGGILILTLVGTYILVQTPGTDTFTAEFKTLEVTTTEIEQELDLLEESVKSGTLTPDAAVAAHARIQSKLTQVEKVYAAADTNKLSKEQRDTMLDTLNAIKAVLLRHQATLVAVDTVVARQMGTTFRGSITKSFKNIVDVAEDMTDEALPEYESEDIDLDQTTDIFLEDVVDGDIDAVETSESSDEEIVVDEGKMEEDTHMDEPLPEDYEMTEGDTMDESVN